MKFTILDTERTNNFNDGDIQNKITALWERNIAIIKKASQRGLVTACIYYQYVSDYHGDYSVSLCIEDNNGVFDTSKYSWQEYKVSNIENGVITTWQTIWSNEDQHKINRAYSFDFERYSPNGDVSILVAVK